MQRYAHETGVILLFEFDLRIKSLTFQPSNESSLSSMELSKCFKKNLTRAGSLKVKIAAKPYENQLLSNFALRQKESGPEPIRQHMIC